MGTGRLNLSLSAGPLVLLLITLLHSSCQCFCKPQRVTLLLENRGGEIYNSDLTLCTQAHASANLFSEGQQSMNCAHWTVATQMLTSLLLFRLLLLSFTTP